MNIVMLYKPNIRVIVAFAACLVGGFTSVLFIVISETVKIEWELVLINDETKASEIVFMKSMEALMNNACFKCHYWAYTSEVTVLKVLHKTKSSWIVMFI